MNFGRYPNLTNWFKEERVYFKAGTGFTDYHAAIVAQEVVSEEWCKKNSPYPQVNVEAIFGEAERVLRDEIETVDAVYFLQRLQPLFGSRGVKTDSLKSTDDWWKCAIAMWPDVVTKRHYKQSPAANDLANLVLGMSKTRRKKSFAGFRKIPKQYRVESWKGVVT